VAGGTAIGLLLISVSARLAYRLYCRYRTDLWEKGAFLAFPLVAWLGACRALHQPRYWA
jgi:multicomponent Na+:H+ antiporter subunit B